MTTQAIRRALAVGAAVAGRLTAPSRDPEHDAGLARQPTRLPLPGTRAGGVLGLLSVVVRQRRGRDDRRAFSWIENAPGIQRDFDHR